MAQDFKSQYLEQIKSNAGLTIVTGVVLLVMGLLAMGSPFIAGISIALLVGSLLIIGGIGQLIFAFKTGKGVFSIILAILTVLIGGYMVVNPAVALGTLTILLAIYFIASGIFEIMLAFQLKPLTGWVWSLFDGIISVLLGGMIWAQFPVSGVWAIGILVGVRLFFTGITLVMLGITARSISKEAMGAT